MTKKYGLSEQYLCLKQYLKDEHNDRKDYRRAMDSDLGKLEFLAFSINEMFRDYFPDEKIDEKEVD